MALSVTCPGCRTVIKVADSLLGKSIKCQACGEMVRAVAGRPVAKPIAAKPVAPDDEVFDALPLDDDEDTPPPSSKVRVRTTEKAVASSARPRTVSVAPAKPAKKSALPLILGGVVGLVVLGGGATVAFLMMKDGGTAQVTNAAPPPSNGPDETSRSQTPPTNTDVEEPVKPVTTKPVEPTKTPVNPTATEPTKPAPAPTKAEDPPKTTPEPTNPVATKPIEPTKPAPVVKPDRLDGASLAKLKASTVYLEVDDGQGGGGSGSGWFGLEPGLIITNAHVIGMKMPGSKEPAKLTAFLDSGLPGKERKYEGQKVKILAVDRDMDLAVLQIVNEKDLPPPMAIEPSTSLNELDRLVALGFPGGRRLSERNRSDGAPVVTVTETAVSAFRTDSAGNRYSIQIQGGVVHGNSGGPVVDTLGRVIGVAVRVDINPANGQMTNIAYAVPSEYVTGLLSGRAVEAEVGQPYTRGGSVVFPVAVRCADAMKRLKSVGIAAWVGEASETPRAPGDVHAVKPGDASYKEVPLSYDKETRIATGEVEFPKQADGRAYWVQPFFSNALVSKWFTAGTAVKVKSPPVDKVVGTLIPKYALGVERKVSVQQVADFTERTELGGKELYRKDLIGQILKVTEAVDKPAGSGNYATLNHSLESLAMLYKQFDQEAELPKGIREVTSGLSRWSSGLTVSKQGAAGVTQPPSHNPGPDAARQDMFKRFAAQLQHLTQASLIPLPGRQVQPGETWGENRIHRFVLEQDHLLQDRPAAKDEHRGHLVREEVVYTYLGRRDRNGRGELVVQVKGVLHPTNAPTVVVGIVTGTAILNEADGDLRELDLKREFDLDTSHGGAVRKAVGTETYKMTREK